MQDGVATVQGGYPAVHAGRVSRCACREVLCAEWCPLPVVVLCAEWVPLLLPYIPTLPSLMPASGPSYPAQYGTLMCTAPTPHGQHAR